MGKLHVMGLVSQVLKFRKPTESSFLGFEKKKKMPIESKGSQLKPDFRTEKFERRKDVNVEEPGEN